MNRHASTGAEVALEKIGDEAVPALIETLRSGSAHGRYKSAVLLGKIGGNAEDAKAALKAASEKDALSAVRSAAAGALVRLTGE